MVTRLTLTMALLATWLLASCGGGGSGNGGGPPPGPTLQSIAVTPSALTASVGGGHGLHATGTYSDGTTKDLTASAAWSSSAATVATVAGGVVTGVSAGTATVSAATSGVSGSSTITILDNTWASAASSPLLLSAQTATVLQDGTVLVLGEDPSSFNAGAGVYNPATDSWTQTSAPSTVRNAATATRLADGRVLVVGGSAFNSVTSTTTYLASAELYDPASKTWAAAAAMPTPRQLHGVDPTVVSPGAIWRV